MSEVAIGCAKRADEAFRSGLASGPFLATAAMDSFAGIPAPARSRSAKGAQRGRSPVCDSTMRKDSGIAVEPSARNETGLGAGGDVAGASAVRLADPPDVAPLSAPPPAVRPSGFRGLIARDVERWVRQYSPEGIRPDGTARGGVAFRLWMNQCGLRAGVIFRISHALWRCKVPFIPGMMSRLNLTLHGIDIPPSVSIGPGLYMPHPVGTVVFAETIGADVTLVAGVTIGMRDDPPRFPCIGDGVYVGAGARILGGVRIGDGAKIGANAVVIKDVPAGATALGVPAVIRLPAVRTTPDAAAPRNGGGPHHARAASTDASGA
jgi:serine O-acetyltransferase